MTMAVKDVDPITARCEVQKLILSYCKEASFGQSLTDFLYDQVSKQVGEDLEKFNSKSETEYEIVLKHPNNKLVALLPYWFGLFMENVCSDMDYDNDIIDILMRQDKVGYYASQVLIVLNFSTSLKGDYILRLFN